jgi:hypothetical protein
MIRILTVTTLCLAPLAAGAAEPAVGPPIDLLAPASSAPAINPPQPDTQRTIPAQPAPPTPPRTAEPAILPLPPAAPIPVVQVQPMFTYALLPGHWQLYGAQYVWVPPEKTPRPVIYWRLAPGRYVWRGGAWVWFPAHYE